MKVIFLILIALGNIDLIISTCQYENKLLDPACTMNWVKSDPNYKPIDFDASTETRQIFVIREKSYLRFYAKIDRDMDLYGLSMWFCQVNQIKDICHKINKQWTEFSNFEVLTVEKIIDETYLYHFGYYYVLKKKLNHLDITGIYYFIVKNVKNITKLRSLDLEMRNLRFAQDNISSVFKKPLVNRIPKNLSKINTPAYFKCSNLLEYKYQWLNQYLNIIDWSVKDKTHQKTFNSDLIINSSLVGDNLSCYTYKTLMKFSNNVTYPIDERTPNNSIIQTEPGIIFPQTTEKIVLYTGKIEKSIELFAVYNIIKSSIRESYWTKNGEICRTSETIEVEGDILRVKTKEVTLDIAGSYAFVIKTTNKTYKLFYEIIVNSPPFLQDNCLPDKIFVEANKPLKIHCQFLNTVSSMKLYLNSYNFELGNVTEAQIHKQYRYLTHFNYSLSRVMNSLSYSISSIRAKHHHQLLLLASNIYGNLVQRSNIYVYAPLRVSLAHTFVDIFHRQYYLDFDLWSYTQDGYHVEIDWLVNSTKPLMEFSKYLKISPDSKQVILKFQSESEQKEIDFIHTLFNNTRLSCRIRLSYFNPSSRKYIRFFSSDDTPMKHQLHTLIFFNVDQHLSAYVIFIIYFVIAVLSCAILYVAVINIRLLCKTRKVQENCQHFRSRFQERFKFSSKFPIFQQAI